MRPGDSVERTAWTSTVILAGEVLPGHWIAGSGGVGHRVQVVSAEPGEGRDVVIVDSSERTLTVDLTEPVEIFVQRPFNR